MNEPVISIALEASATWRATGRYLGYPIAISEVSLWDCLDQCKERLWDIEICHDAAAGLLASWEQKMPGQAAVARDGPAAASCGDIGGGSDEVSVLRTGHGFSAPDAASDDLLRMARHVVLSEQVASVSLLQARLHIEADVAADALATLEAESTVGPAETEGKRKVRRAWMTTDSVPDELSPAPAAAQPTPLKKQLTQGSTRRRT